MTFSSNIDYINNHFEFPILTKIHGHPDYEQLKQIKDELRANATSVTANLGGGAHGHLGLVLDDAEYTFVSPTAYVRPLHPGVSVIPPGTPNWQAQMLREDHKEAIRLFNEITNIEKALLKQLGKALPDLYLKQFRNSHSNTITTNLPTILEFLFTTYGDIEQEHLDEKKEQLCAKVFDITQPMAVMFNEVEDLLELSTAAANPYTPRQVIKIAEQLIKNFNDFEKGLEEWYALPAENQTWPDFKLHFEQAHKKLRKLRGKTMRNTSFSQTANMITDRVLEQIQAKTQEEKEDILRHIADSEQKVLSALSAIAPEDRQDVETERIEPPQSTVNAVTSDAVQLEMLKILKEIKMT